MNIDWFTFAIQIINFVVLVYLLNRFLYGPITRAMNEREAKIADRMKATEAQLENAAAAENHFDELSHELEHQRNDLFEVARSESEELREKLVAETRTEINSRRDDWLESLHREQATLVNLVRERASKQTLSASRRALTQLADAELEEQTLATFLKQLKQLPAGQAERIRQETLADETIQVRTAFDVSDSWQLEIRNAIERELAFKKISFETDNKLICGIELYAGGNKIGWSLRDYFESLGDEIQGMLVKEEQR